MEIAMLRSSFGSRAVLQVTILAVMALLSSTGAAQSTVDLLEDARTRGDVLMQGMGYAAQRYSPLKQILPWAEHGHDRTHGRRPGAAVVARIAC